MRTTPTSPPIPPPKIAPALGEDTTPLEGPVVGGAIV